MNDTRKKIYNTSLTEEERRKLHGTNLQLRIRKGLLTSPLTYNSLLHLHLILWILENKKNSSNLEQRSPSLATLSINAWYIWLKYFFKFNNNEHTENKYLQTDSRTMRLIFIISYMYFSAVLFFLSEKQNNQRIILWIKRIWKLITYCLIRPV